MLYISLAHLRVTLPYKKVSKCSQIKIFYEESVLQVRVLLVLILQVLDLLVHILRAGLCKNREKWELKNFDPPSCFACR